MIWTEGLKDNLPEEVVTMDLLKGVRVIDLSELAPGPFCTMFLADMGADVIKVERPKGDPVRRLIPGVYEAFNRNKQSIVLNLKNEEGRGLLFRLIEKADVFVESYRPGVLERLGVSYEKAKSINEGIVYCSISGYGQDGPYRDWPGHDINYCAVAGISSINGQPAGPPDIGTGIPIADYSSSLYACISILSMLYAHRGGYLDVSMTDCALNLMITRVNEYMARGKPSKEKFLGRGGYGIFKAKDDRYFAIAAVEKHFWYRLCQVIGHEDMAKDSRFDTWIKRNENMNELNSVLDRIFVSRSRDEWVSLLSQADVPCSPVNFIDDILDDPHIKARGQIEKRERDGEEISNILFPTLFDGERLPLRSLAPAYPEQDTDQILRGIGLNELEIERLKKSGFIV
jgi:crotonobetainyl-CoA:carnitine CoA-transferase CaiB-like acyl-CoA transferase